LEKELNLDPDSNPDPDPESDPELITDPDPNLKIISDPDPDAQHCLSIHVHVSNSNLTYMAILIRNNTSHDKAIKNLHGRCCRE
jgi:hypothetical protein